MRTHYYGPLRMILFFGTLTNNLLVYGINLKRISFVSTKDSFYSDD